MQCTLAASVCCQMSVRQESVSNKQDAGKDYPFKTLLPLFSSTGGILVSNVTIKKYSVTFIILKKHKSLNSIQLLTGKLKSHQTLKKSLALT